uniref:Uncharacterized protein n=1 Tax=Picea glauca TaxID=3330 RepID=A0A101LVG7_PICGL|nr:hypothetical protein ABT39_MTgene1897 [Picea glauca]QHR92538.1 hypothetical protein Q903MT_gene6584 [Picea sitchensis]
MLCSFLPSFPSPLPLFIILLSLELHIKGYSISPLYPLRAKGINSRGRLIKQWMKARPSSFGFGCVGYYPSKLE